MAVRNTSTSSTFDAWRQETNSIAVDAGDVSTLNPTMTATNLTDAVKENNAAVVAASGDAVAMAIALGG